MKVLALTNLFPNARQPNRGVFNLQQLTALSRLCEVRVIAPIAWQPWSHGLSRPMPYEERWNEIPTVHPFYAYTPGFGRSAYPLLMAASLYATVRRVVDEFRPDALYACWAYPDAVAAAVLARQLRLPWVAKVQGSDINVFAQTPIRQAQIRWALRRASCTIAVSEALKRRLIEIGVPGGHVRVLHNGVNLERFGLQDQQVARRKTGLPLERPIILFVGNLLMSKGAEDLIEAMRHLAADQERSPLAVLVGEGSDRELLTAQIRRHGIEDAVRLIGARPHAEIPDWIAAADLLCLPSHREGCPNVVLEALACGRPVVASNVGAVPDFVDAHRGVVVEPQQPAQLAAALRDVTARDWDAARVRSRVAGLSWEDNAHALYKELTRAAGQPAIFAGRDKEVTAP